MSSDSSRTGALRGLHLLVTRAEEDAHDWAVVLRDQGARVSFLPAIRCEALSSPELVDRLSTKLLGARTAVFASRRAVEVAAHLLGDAVQETFTELPVAAVGLRTATAARALLGRCDWVSPDQTALGLLPLLKSAGTVGGCESVVFVAAEQGRRDLEEALAASGTSTERVAVYRTVPAARLEPPRDLHAESVDAVLLASPSAVTGFEHQVDHQAIERGAIELFSIGPTTTQAIEAMGWKVAGEALERSVGGLIEAVATRRVQTNESGLIASGDSPDEEGSRQ